MILKIHSDASYLSELKARSRAAGYFYLGNKEDKPEINNGAILATTEIQKHILSSAAEAKVGSAFLQAKKAVPLRMTLYELHRPQPATPIQVDNSTASGIANDTVKQRRSKAINMRFYWLQDQVNQNQFHVYWAPGSTNLADYFSKHHPAMVHQQQRYYYLYSTTDSTKYRNNYVKAPLRGCADAPHCKLDSTSGFRVPITQSSGYEQYAPARHAGQA